MELNRYRHFYLYAKKHYVQSEDVVADLKKIVAECTDIDPKWVSVRDVLALLTSAAYPHIADSESSFSRFIESLLPDPFFEREKSTDITIRLIEKLLSVLHFVTVYNSLAKMELINLGYATPDVLPLTEFGKKRLQDQVQAQREAQAKG